MVWSLGALNIHIYKVRILKNQRWPYTQLCTPILHLGASNVWHWIDLIGTSSLGLGYAYFTSRDVTNNIKRTSPTWTWMHVRALKTNIDPKTKAMHHAHTFESFKCMKLVHIISASEWVKSQSWVYLFCFTRYEEITYKNCHQHHEHV